MNRMMGCLKTRLRVWLVIVGVVPVFAVAIFAWWSLGHSLREQAASGLATTAEATGRLVEVWVSGIRDGVALRARAPQVTTALTTWRKATEDGQTRVADYVQTDAYRTLAADLIAALGGPGQTQDPCGLWLVDAHGRVVFNTAGQTQPGTNWTTEEWADTAAARVIQQVSQGQTWVVDLGRPGPNSKTLACLAGHAIRDGEGRVCGVVLTQRSSARLAQVIDAGVGRDAGSRRWLLTETEAVIVESGTEGLTLAEDSKAVRNALGRSRMQVNPSAGSGFTYLDAQRGKVLANACTVPGLGWTVIAEIDQAKVLALVHGFNWTVLAIGIFVFFVVFGLGWFVSNRMSHPIIRLTEAINRLATGDLSVTIPVEGQGETRALAEGLRSMVEEIARIVASSEATAEQIAVVRSEILSSCEQQVCSARDQSSAVSETTSAAAELSKTSEQIGENIKTISQMATHVLAGMEKIKHATDQTNQILTSLNEKSKQIGNITELIDDVADQTNLLAVNASIEAARAGEQGRGFTVVADQISKLADSTAKSTKDITSLVEMIRHEMSNAIIAMEQSLSGVEEEILLAKESAAKSKEIAMSANQQISGSRQIAEAMASIDDTMKQIASGAQRSADAAGQLTTLADELKDSMAQFKVTEHGR